MRTLHYLPLFILVIWLVLVRWIYITSTGGPAVAPDTYGYFILGNRMMLGTEPVINDQRTPIYPLFLAGVMAAGGNFNGPMLSTQFFQSAWVVVVVQSLLGVFCIILLYKLLGNLGFGSLIQFILTFFVGTNILVFAWDRVLVAESLTTFWLMATTYTTFLVLKKTTARRWLMLLALFIFGFLLKPVYIAFPLAILPVVAWYKRDKTTLLTLLVVLLLYALVPLGYVRSNVAHFHYQGVNHTMDINLLGKILQFKLPAEASSNHTALYQALVAWRQQNGSPDPYAFLRFYDPQLLVANGKQDAINEIKSFVMPIMLSNLPRYLQLSLADVPTTLIARNDSLAPPDPALLSGVWNVLWQIYTNIQYLTLLFIPLLILTCPILFQLPSLAGAMLVALGTITAYHVAIYAVSGYEDYGRLMSVTLPQLYVFCVWGLARVLHKVFTRKT